VLDHARGTYAAVSGKGDRLPLTLDTRATKPEDCRPQSR
jgi:hypothetical protein